MKKKSLRGSVKTLNEMKDIQGTDGTWNYAPYMLGMYNGLEICLSVLENREPIFKCTPKVWLYDEPVPELAKECK